MRFALVALLFLVSCRTSPKREIQSERCGPTPVMASEFKQFGLNPEPGKINVMRVFATWCPYCKEDLKSIGEKFKSGEWKPETVQLLLMAYRNRHENKTTLDTFVKKDFRNFDIPLEAVQIVYVDRDFKELGLVTAKDGQPLLSGWEGVPFALVFGKDGRLAFRGHFTQSPVHQKEHYSLITRLTSESCTAPAAP